MKTEEISYWIQAIIYLLKNSFSKTIAVLELITFLIDLLNKRIEFVSYYIYIFIFGLLYVSVKVIKEKIIIGPKLSLGLFPEEGKIDSRTKTYPIRWEKLKKGHSIVTRYIVYIKNAGATAKMPFVSIKKSKIKDNFFSLNTTPGSLKTDEEDAIRVTLGLPGTLIKKESIQIAKMSFVLNEQVKVRPGNFFEVPITFGASNAEEKVTKWKFKYKKNA